MDCSNISSKNKIPSSENKQNLRPSKDALSGAGFRKILKNRNFFLLWLGQIISQFGDRLNQMALIALVYQRAPGSALQLAKIISFTIIPVFIIGPVAGVYVDRWDRRKTMYICDLLRCVLVLLIPLAFFYKRSFFPIYLIVFIIFCISRFFVPAKMAIVPDLVDKGSLLLANSLVATTGMIAAAFGLGLSGILVSPAWIGVEGGFYLDSLTFFISAFLIFLISKRIATSQKESLINVSRGVLEVIRKSVFSEMKEGFFYLIKHKELRYIIGVLFLLGAALGSVNTVIIVFVQQALHSATKDLGLLAMFLAGGLFFGSIIYGRFGHRVALFKTIFLSLSCVGFTLIAFSFILKSNPHFLVAAVLAIVLGVVISPIITACNTLIHQLSHDEMRGKVFSSVEIVIHLAFLVCMLLSAFLADKLGQAKILIGAGVILALFGILSLINESSRNNSRL
ncbi:MAG: hypothetical protein COV72_05210 [Candidatus Omnitrophica bacterium CG11_big_fil_rev_8_21_14_0_20_42_13]|uniref:Major facilitator superfamily (MFS) profile domain-containing protein n=1 Tax=Candidatus Ghiorseimicrobium undicola TaxID=1974746 RepID=A0A2H0LXE9_9BACT|nr:MAG: hypothetical protein COV72_05210 [Candidatus Omnitrophica bacterium CG11_big_fil_rev_8_21_14_0_20_42_13]